MPEKLKAWTPELVAKYAGCAVQTIYRQIDEDESPFPGAFRIGKRKWLIPETDVFEYFGFDPRAVGLEIVKS